MYFSMIKLRPGISPREIVKLTKLNGYHAHQLIWKLFADHPDRKRDFIYRHDSVDRWPSFYTVSSREPLDNTELWDISTKKYTPKLQSGQRLSFTLRVNPIRTRRDENGKQQRHDVVMEEKLKLKADKNDVDIAEIIQEQGCRWLEKHSAAYGFNLSLNQVRVDGYLQHKLFKGKGAKPITFSTVDFNGILTVADPELFVDKCLFAGIGPAKGFGCGLMLVRRI